MSGFSYKNEVVEIELLTAELKPGYEGFQALKIKNSYFE